MNDSSMTALAFVLGLAVMFAYAARLWRAERTATRRWREECEANAPAGSPRGGVAVMTEGKPMGPVKVS